MTAPKDQRTYKEWLQDIVLWGEMLERPVSGYEVMAFVADEKTRNASAKCIEAIGEAARRLLESNRARFDEHFATELREAHAARNRLAHGYYAVDWEVVWKAAVDSVPPLVAEARKRLQKGLTS